MALVALLQRFAREIASGQVRLVGKAVDSARGTVRFAINRERSVWGTLSREFAERNASQGAPDEFVEVESVRFGDILHRHGMPYYLKIDIEGREMACLEPLHDFAARPKHLSIESPATTPGFGFRDTLAELRTPRDLGYARFKHVSQAGIPGTPGCRISSGPSAGFGSA